MSRPEMPGRLAVLSPISSQARVAISAVAARAVAARLSDAYRERDIGPARLVIVRYAPADTEPPSGRRIDRARARFLLAVRASLNRGKKRGVALAPGEYRLA